MYSTLFHLVIGAALTVTTPAPPAPPAVTVLHARAASDTIVAAVQKAAPQKTVVEVDNAAFLDANVYALQGYRRVRLGTVNGLSKQKLDIPNYLVDPGLPLRFVIDPIGGRRASVSDELMVYQGDTVGLYVPPF